MKKVSKQDYLAEVKVEAEISAKSYKKQAIENAKRIAKEMTELAAELEANMNELNFIVGEEVISGEPMVGNGLIELKRNIKKMNNNAKKYYEIKGILEAVEG